MQTVAELIYVGKREYSYDFTNRETGERVKGTKHFAYFADAANGHTVQEVEVRGEEQVGAASALEFGKPYTVTIEPAAKQNRVIYILQEVAASGGRREG